MHGKEHTQYYKITTVILCCSHDTVKLYYT